MTVYSSDVGRCHGCDYPGQGGIVRDGEVWTCPRCKLHHRMGFRWALAVSDDGRTGTGYQEFYVQETYYDCLLDEVLE